MFSIKLRGIEDVESAVRKDTMLHNATVSHCQNLNSQVAVLKTLRAIGAKKLKVDAHDTKSKPVEEKPFIFLDVSILREYLAVELDLRTSTPFDLERAIDDWVFLIFFVGNDFLPHLPSLEIREGAIDTLLAIWKREFDKMGGYVTNHGQVDLEKAQFILTGLADAEDDIFRRRKESEFLFTKQNAHLVLMMIFLIGEDRQNANSKRRRDDDRARGNPQHIKFAEKEEKGKMQLNGVEMVAVNTPPPASAHPSLPAKPTHSVVARLPGSGNGASEIVTTKRGISVIGGSAQSVLDSRRANRMASINANLSAAEALKRELAGTSTEAAQIPETEVATIADSTAMADSSIAEGNDEDADGEPEEYVEVEASAVTDPDTPRGKKRKAVQQTPLPGHAPVQQDGDDAEGDDDDEDAEGEDDNDAEAPPNPEADQPLPKKSKLQVNPDGTVEYDDTVMYVTRQDLVKSLTNLFAKGCGSRDTGKGTTVKSLVSN